MPIRSSTLLVILSLLIGLTRPSAAEPPKFRTDADGPVTAKPPGRTKDKATGPEWYQLVPGEFPPEGSAHAISGELMLVDHLERRFQIRVDRNDSQDRGVWDLPLDAAMLPYGAIYYHGAPAALQDIPLGTHLRGLFYLKEPNDKTPPLNGPHNNRRTPEADFRRCLRIEDDFSFHKRQQQFWRIETVKLEEPKLTAQLLQNGKPSGQPRQFDLLTSTRVIQGASYVDLQSLQPGQTVLLNLTWVTLYGPGRITDVWVDDASRDLATKHQMERHHNYVRERGLPGFVTDVDDEKQVVTITFFNNVDVKFFSELATPAATVAIVPAANATAGQASPTPNSPRGSVAVARETLMTYDPVNDRKNGEVLEIKAIPIQPGSSGVQIKVKMDMLLEGYRPRHVVRFYPPTWKVIALPREEQYFGRE